MRHKKRPRIFISFLILAVVALLGLIVMQLWNYILPEISGLKRISYWQAVGLLILCKILFGSFRPGYPGFRRGTGGAGGAWRNKLMNMSEEERAKFKEEWRTRRFGPEQPPAEN